MEGHLDGIQMHLDDLTRCMGDTNSRVGDLTVAWEISRAKL
jgi:hypothetical protein